MKKTVAILFFVIVKCQVLFSQKDNLVVFFTDAITNSVPVYADDTTIVSYTSVKEDTEKENWHDVEILEQSNNRYKVCITAINEENIATLRQIITAGNNQIEDLLNEMMEGYEDEEKE